jgi:membrane protein implicated in regulation of membrane protease activity
MTWESFFLACFVFGFVLSLVAFFAGSAHLHLHTHVSHADFSHAPGVHGHGVHAHGEKSGPSRFNFGTVTAFLTWFGGAGYILSSWGRIGIALILMFAVFIGVIGGTIIFLFAAKVLARGDRPLDPADYRIIGVLGTVSSPVRSNGTGEMIFVQEGRRSALPIRSESGTPIPAGKEVVVTRYEGGVAYVREWEELTA